MKTKKDILITIDFDEDNDDDINLQTEILMDIKCIESGKVKFKYDTLKEEEIKAVIEEHAKQDYVLNEIIIKERFKDKLLDNNNIFDENENELIDLEFNSKSIQIIVNNEN
eukprot:506741_1